MDHGNMKHLKTAQSCTCYYFLILLTPQNSHLYIYLYPFYLHITIHPVRCFSRPKISLYKWLGDSNELHWTYEEFTRPMTPAICLPTQIEDALHNRLHWTGVTFLLSTALGWSFAIASNLIGDGTNSQQQRAGRQTHITAEINGAVL